MSEGYSNLLEFYSRGPYAPFLREHRLAGSAPARLLDVHQPMGCYPDDPTPDLVLGLNLSGFRSEFDFGAGRWRGRQRKGDLFLIPPYTATDVRCDDAQLLMLIAIPSSFLHVLSLNVDQLSFADFGRLHTAPFRDQFVESLCRRLWVEAADDSPFGSLFADSAVQTLALALLRAAELIQPAGEHDRGTPLAPWRLARLREFIDANLHRDLGLVELAAVVGVGPRHLTRGFKAATGEPPYRYVIGLRVERAKELLSGTNLPVAEVALACGFSDQSKLGLAFKRLVGVTPSAYRRQR